MNTVFVVGFPRSGTTLVAETVSRITGYAVLPETRFYEENKFLFRGITGKALKSMLTEKRRMQDVPVDIDGLFEDDVRYGVSDIFGLLLDSARQGCCGIIEKSPIHILHLEKMRREFPDAVIIGIVRSPYDVVASLSKTPWNNRSVMYNQLDWGHRNRILFDSPNVDILIRYEDLLKDGVGTCKKLMKLIVGRVDTAAIEQAVLMSRSSSAVPSWEIEWKRNANGPLLSDKSVSSTVLPYVDSALAVDLGYLEYAGSSGRIKRYVYNKVFGLYFLLRSTAKSIYYTYRLYKIFGREAEGVVR